MRSHTRLAALESHRILGVMAIFLHTQTQWWNLHPFHAVCLCCVSQLHTGITTARDAGSGLTYRLLPRSNLEWLRPLWASSWFTQEGKNHGHQTELMKPEVALISWSCAVGLACRIG